jgi:hypothetical protein
MNLRGIVRQAITAVNPDTLCTWQQSTGSTVNADGSLTPTYNVVDDVPVQVQGLSARELAHTDYLNIQGVLRKVYQYGNVQGVVRPNFQGGDLLSFAQTYGGTLQVWLVVSVLETWPDAVDNGWSSAIVCLQNDVAVSPS